MRRACKLTLKFLTASKKRQIANLLAEYRHAVNFYIKSLWTTKGKLDKATLALLKHTRLSERYKSQALKQALEIVIATKKAAKATGAFASRPHFKGSATLDSKFVSIEPGAKSFDLVLRLSTLRKGKRITVPTKCTAMLNKWLGLLGAKLIQGCSLSERGIVLWVELFDLKPREQGQVLGIDVGVNNLIADSDGKLYGTEFKTISSRIRRAKKGSKGCFRARITRNHFMNRTAKQLPWAVLSTIGVEDLTNLKRGKKKGRGKAFRKAMAPWTYRQVLNRVTQLASENRVRLVKVNPANTSRTCPKCGVVSKENRKGEDFLCTGCGHSGDSDVVGAQNVLARTLATLRNVEFLGLKKAM